VLSPNVRVKENAKIDHSVILANVTVGNGAIIRRAILDKNVVVPEGARIGVDREADLARGFTVSDNGVTVVGKGVVVER
jgi:glucose-1-phosphate adenylyltransferase